MQNGLLLLLCSGFILFLHACAQAPVVDGEYDRPPNGRLDDGSRLYQHAAAFDRVVRRAARPGELESLKDSCRNKGNDNPFCYSLTRLRTLEDVLEEKHRLRSPIEAKPVIPVVPVIAQGKVTNWKAVRSAQVPSLLKGLLTLPIKDLTLIAQHSLREKRCPNNLSIALAATLEDYLPDGADPSQIGALYHQGGVCTRRDPVDREHFYTRAGLFYFLARNYSESLKILKKVKPTDILSGRASYWLYRAATEVGDKKTADDALERVISRHRFSFHALLALKLKGIEPSYPPQTEYRTRSKRNPKVNPLAIQAETLKKYGFDYSAAVMVDWAVGRFRKLEPQFVLYLVDQGDAAAKVKKGTETLLFNPELVSEQTLQLIYPRPYFRHFSQHASSVNPHFALSVARKESRFNPKAISVANAQGLLQLNPDTAARLGADGKTDLLDPVTNIALGTDYLRELSRRYGGNLARMLAAYNAGEIQVENWVRRFPTNDLTLFIDLIPYRETRDYVGAVFSYYYWYRRLYEGAPLRDTFSFL